MRRRLLDRPAGLPFQGIVGPDDSALRLAKRCESLGIVFEGSQAQAIYESTGRHGSRGRRLRAPGWRRA